MLARTCNRKPCELTPFETTWRMALPAARTSCRACHVRFRHDVEPEERFKPNRNKYHAVVAARNRSDTVGEITIRRQKPLVLRIMVEQGRTMILFLSELTPRCEQIFPHRCCFQPVRRIRQQCPRSLPYALKQPAQKVAPGLQCPSTPVRTRRNAAGDHLGSRPVRPCTQFDPEPVEKVARQGMVEHTVTRGDGRLRCRIR